MANFDKTYTKIALQVPYKTTFNAFSNELCLNSVLTVFLREHPPKDQQKDIIRPNLPIPLRRVLLKKYCEYRVET